MYSWHSRTPKVMLFSAYFGRLILTTHRLLFLSTGSNGTARALGFNLIGGVPLQLTLGQTRTDELDTSALVNPGSINLDLRRVTRADVSRRFDFSSYLSVQAQDDSGSLH